MEEIVINIANGLNKRLVPIEVKRIGKNYYV
jgi:hypothetical protein